MKRDNLAFFADALRALRARKIGNDGLMTIGLVGQRDIPGVMLRSAQSALRWDIRPSLWSHAFLVAGGVRAGAKSLANTPILEVPLWPRSGEFPKPENNGVVRGRLGEYADRIIDANVALFAVSMTDKEAQQVRKRAEDFNSDRARYNHWQTLGVWHGYLWAQHSRPNPLLESVPIPSSAFVEMAFEAIGLDMTPGANERHSAPEHLWNAAVWWDGAFKSQKRGIIGYYVHRDPHCAVISTDEKTGQRRRPAMRQVERSKTSKSPRVRR